MLPKQLHYAPKNVQYSAKPRRDTIQPINGTVPASANVTGYGLGSIIEIEIPTKNNEVLVPAQSYLKFNMLVKNGSNTQTWTRFDKCGAHGIIDYIKVYSGNNCIENIQNYGMVVTNIVNCKTPISLNEKLAMLAGMQIDEKHVLTGNTILKSDENPMGGNETNNGNNNYCLNLYSILGCLCPYYLPLFMMTNSPLRLEIKLVNDFKQFISSSQQISAVVLQDVEYVASMIELNTELIAQIKPSLLNIPLQTYRSNSHSAVITTGCNTRIQVPCSSLQVSSLKSLYVYVRDKYLTLNYLPFSSARYGLTEYQIRIGSNEYPKRPIRDLKTFYSELLKASDTFHNDSKSQSSMTWDSYNTNVSTSDNSNYSTFSGTFAIGYNFENFLSNIDLINNGKNTNNDPIYVDMVFNGSQATKSARFDVIGCYDVLLYFENGLAYIKF